MAVVTAERHVRTVVVVRSREIVRGTMEQPRHAGHDDLAHVGGLRLLVGLREVPVDGIAHLCVHAAAVLFPPETLEVRLGQRHDGRHPPVAIAGIAAVARLAMDFVAAHPQSVRGRRAPSGMTSVSMNCDDRFPVFSSCLPG